MQYPIPTCVSDESMDGVADSFFGAFQSPPVEYRPAPFTILNDEYEPGRGEKQLTRLIEGLAEVGYGGAYLHPRPGLITEYLSPRWFELIRHCIKECKRCGIIPHLYDENSYPSGFSGGHVPALVPEARSRYVVFTRGRGLVALPGTFLSLCRWENDNPGASILRDEISEDSEWVAFVMADLPSTGWHGDTIYPSLLDPRTTQAFLQTTHEVYRRELGPLWSDASSIFTDEPHLPGASHGPWSPGLHLTPYVLGQFQQRLGYDLSGQIASLFFDVGDYSKVRYHFYNLCHQLWMENWAVPLESWCQDHGIKLTGHYLEHDWPCPYATPGHVHLLAHMDWPGTDMLSCFLLKGHQFFDIQGFDSAPAGCEPHGLLILRQTHSVANQLGKERVINESWGAGGNESAPEDWMRIGRWMIVHGVNLLIPHCSWDTIRGARKGDHPQNFGPQSSWFKYIRSLNDELTRLCWVSNQGECVNRVLVIDSLTSAFCLSRKAESSTPAAISALDNACTESAEASLPSILALKNAADQFAQSLSDAQIDYDLGDEYVIEEFGSVHARGFQVGKRCYSMIALIPGAYHLRSVTLQKLEGYISSGGHLGFVSTEDFLVDGEKCDALSKLRIQYPHQVHACVDADELQRLIADRFPPRLTLSGSLPITGVAHMHRTTMDGEMFLIVNSSPQPVSAQASLITGRRVVWQLNPADGEAKRLPSVARVEGVEVPIRISAGGACILFCCDEEGKGEDASPSEGMKDLIELPVELLRVEPLEGNILAVDYCSLSISGCEYPAEDVMAANDRYWKAHGMDSNGWNNIIQYRDQVLARDRSMQPDSGGKVCYRFEIEADVLTSDIQLVMECPELWTVSVNKREIQFAMEDIYRDPRFHRTVIGPFLRAGVNEVVLEARPFSVRQEIAPIYLIGDFSCVPSSLGFRIAASRPLSWGSWRMLGLPFYDAELSYVIRVPKGTRYLSFPRATWGGALIIVRLAGREIGRTMEAPWMVDLPELSCWELEVIVVGLPKNLFGPWHDPNHRWGVASAFMWMGQNLPKEPQPGRQYQQLDLGLWQAPIALGIAF